MASVLKVDKLDPQSGTALEIGTSGDTVTVPSGATLDISSATLTPPATLPASSGVNLTALNATNLGSGTVAIARGGTGAATLAAAGLSNTPAFSSYLANNTSQAISDGVLTKVTLNTEWFDSDSTFDNSTNYRFTCPAGGAGQYLFCWQIFLYAANTSSNIEYVNTKLYKNGSAFIGTDMDYRDNEPRSVVIGNSVILDIADADYFELYGLVKQNSGSPSFYGGDRQTYFSGMRLIT